MIKSNCILPFFLGVMILTQSCMKDQYQGSHASVKKQETIAVKNVSYHQKEANKVIDENIKNKDVNEKHRDKRRKQQDLQLASLNKSDAKVKKFKRRQVYKFY